MARFGFVGATYQSQSPNIDDELCMNVYPEPLEAASPKAPMALLSTPGLRVFSPVPGGFVAGPIRGQLSVNGRLFVAGGDGTNLFEVFADGTANPLGNVQNDGLPVSMASNGRELLVCSNGSVWTFDMVTNVFTIAPVLGNMLQVGFSDGYFIAVQRASRTFQLSALEDSKTWDPAMVFEISVFGDNIVSFIVSYRQLWFFGTTQSVAYYNSGDQFNPFQPIPGAFMTIGSAARDGVVELDNSLFLMNKDKRGGGMVWRLNGYAPLRVSNHAVETMIQSFSQKYGEAGLSSMVAYGYQDQGHTFYVMYFPRPSATLVYDCAASAAAGVSMWHQRGFWDTNFGAFLAHHSWNHSYAFGKHLVGDWSSNALYEMGVYLFDDAGVPKRWVRRCPHVSRIDANQMWEHYNRLQVDAQVGVGLAWPAAWSNAATYPLGQGTLYNGVLYVSQQPANTNHQPDTSPAWWAAAIPAGIDPQMTLRWSDDSSQTWSNAHSKSMGRIGAYKTRLVWRRLGRALKGRRVFEASGSDPVPYRIADADLVLGQGAYGQ